MLSGSPIMRRRQLGAELRRLRLAAGMRIEDAATRLECSASRISRIETGQDGAIAKARDVRDLAALYRVADEHTVEELLGILGSARQPGWWSAYLDVLPAGLHQLVGLENGACRARVYAPLVVPDLLQTADYARALLSLDRERSAGDTERLVELRVDRQRRLAGDEPLKLCAVLDEAVLRRPVGGPATARAQLEHLAAVAQRPDIALRVVPFGEGAHIGLVGGFTVLDFDAPDASIVHVESPAGNHYVERPAEVGTFERDFGALSAVAADRAESIALLRRAAAHLVPA